MSSSSYRTGIDENCRPWIDSFFFYAGGVGLAGLIPPGSASSVLMRAVLNGPRGALGAARLTRAYSVRRLQLRRRGPYTRYPTSLAVAEQQDTRMSLLSPVERLRSSL